MKKLKKLQLSTEPTTPPPPITHEETTHYINLYNHEGTKSSISTLINSSTSPTYLQTDFDKTKYSNENAFGVFYNKYHKNQEYKRKGVTSLSTPSFNFINYVLPIIIVEIHNYYR